MRLAAILVALALATPASAATRGDIADDARAIIAQVDTCDHSPAVVQLAYLQARKGVQVVQMTTALPYVAYPTEADLTALVGRVLPLPRTTSSRLLTDGEVWFGRSLGTLQAGAVCPT